uniref:GNAT family N-acetyltransferase n=1 Tax=uncultured Eudoraea sp. TaxID=1035614 RepID=UPI0026312EB2
MLKKELIDFYFGLFERGVLPDIYSNISFSDNNHSIRNLTSSKEIYSQRNATIYLVKYIPTYLNPNLKLHFRAIRIFEIKGYAISLKGISSVEEYLAIQMNRKLRASILRRKKRLELCFNIRYEVLYNEISKEKYAILMTALRSLLVRRFKQRNEINERLIEWDKFYNLFFTLINTGKASLFTIYEGSNPIALSLNYHLDKIFFGAISSYDIDYSKFGLGQILVYKRLEWCINKKFKIFDMSMGNPEYKIKWCNNIYDFEHHIVYRPTSLPASILARSIALKMYLKNYLKSKNVHLLYREVKARFKKKVKVDEKLNESDHKS